MLNSTDLCKLPKTGNAAYYPGYKWPTLQELYLFLTGHIPDCELHDAENDVMILKQCHQILLQVTQNVYIVNH